MRSFKKMGLLFLTLVIALAGVGVGFAAWTDSITLEGTVNTGSVDLEVVGYSGTHVWKDITVTSLTDYGTEIVVHDWEGNETEIPSDALAWSGARPGGLNEADVVMEWYNIFPGIPFKADVLLHYNGTIPAKVNSIGWEFTEGADWLNALLANGDMTISAKYVENSEGQDRGITPGTDVGPGFQLHWSDIVKLEVVGTLPQDNELMNLSGAAIGWIEVVQWNEYPYVSP